MVLTFPLRDRQNNEESSDLRSNWSTWSSHVVDVETLVADSSFTEWKKEAILWSYSILSQSHFKN